MNISIAMITKNFNFNTGLDDFLKNAEKFGHKIYSVIVVYSHKIDKTTLKYFSKKVKVHAVKINDKSDLYKDLLYKGVSSKYINRLLKVKTLSTDGIVPYGINRNHAILKAMLTGTDILFFIDTDVYPYVLRKEKGQIIKEEIDFIGAHMTYMKKENIIVTTSDYSGYYIIPPMEFEGMKELFIGLQKEIIYEYIKSYNVHNCLKLDSEIKEPFVTHKILGGNLAIKLESFDKLPPFYSSYYSPDGKNNVLSRGEDTILGLKSKTIKEDFIDIDVKIFHDTYNNYPNVPDIKNNKNIKDRFYYACLGWIGRNPFLNWLIDEDLSNIEEEQLKNIKFGALKLSEYLNDDRFLILPEALENSYNNLPHVIKDYKKTIKSWEKTMIKLKKGDGIYEDIIN
ncbi:hypothetical protein [Senegalia massiliensis]|uniref:hypothetical protein n=1 Tax=Senegalia massiliensis TaxID=1720316 RepID=UPI0010318F14|nr:hypothetical protein [Senegalia massiliensis]